MRSIIARMAGCVLTSFCLTFFSTTLFAATIKLQNTVYDTDTKLLIVKGKLIGPGEGDDVLLVDLDNALELARATSAKQFLFKIPYESILDVPCQVEVSSATESVSADVSNCAGSGNPIAFTLSGVVTDEPIPYATVTVELDGVTYTTTADEFGNYSLPVLTSNINQLLKIDASATDAETGDTIDFVNLSGTFLRAVDGNSTGNVTNVTTASYILAVEANGGTEPTSVEELQSAETSIDASELFELAALIKLIVDDPNYDLPEGQTSLIEFISDPTAVDAYVATLDPVQLEEDLNAAISDILSDSDLVAGFTEGEIPERYYAVPATNPGYIARRGEVLEFDTGGTFTGAILAQTYSDEAIDQSFTWLIEAGRLVLDLNAPIQASGSVAVQESQIPQGEKDYLLANEVLFLQEDRSLLGFTYTRVSDGTLVDIVRREERASVTYQDAVLPGGGSFSPSGQPYLVIDSEEQTLRSSRDVEPIAFTPACPGTGRTECVPGAWAGDFHYSPGADPFGGTWPATAYGDIADFAADGTVSGRLSGFSANWSIDQDGTLIISYPDGWSQRIRALDSLGREFGVFQDFSDGSSRFANYTMLVRAENGAALTETDVINVPGKYWNGEINAWQVGAFDENGQRNLDYRFGWQFDDGLIAPGSGRNRFGLLNACGKFELITEMNWTAEPDGTIRIDRFPTLRGPNAVVREWLPIASDTFDGDRVIYVMEVERQLNGAGSYDVRIPARINIEREIDLITDYDCSLSR